MAAPMKQYRDAMKEMVASDLVDIMLMSLSSAEALVQEGIFENSNITPAVRLNDATDIWGYRGQAIGKNHPLRLIQLKLKVHLNIAG